MERKMQILWHDSLDSTNNEAARRIESLADLSVIAAVEQYSGRGQRGNVWHSSPGDNLTFSIVLKGNGSLAALPVTSQFDISRLSTLAVHGFLAKEGIDAKIKWPNDIYVGNRKICGMLIENSLSGAKISWSIIGIGLNLNQKDFPPQLMNPTSLTLLTGRRYSLESGLEDFCVIFSSLLPLLKDMEGRKKLDGMYSEHLYRKGEWHEFRDLRTEEVFRGKIDGVTKEGLLKAVTLAGQRKEFNFKEIGYII